MFILPSSICQAKPRMRPLVCVMFVMPRYIFRYNFIRQLLDFRRAVRRRNAEFFCFRRPQQANFLDVSLLRFLIVEKHIKKRYLTSVLPTLYAFIH